MKTRLTLVNMPFADWERPSFALSQLSALVKREFPDELEVEVHYLNLDFVSYFGTPIYEAIAEEVDHLVTGVGEWLFRQVAFPDEPDNTAEYFRRYYREPAWADFRNELLARRAGLADYCGDVIERHDLATADIVGFTSMFAQTVPSIALARMIKERNPAANTILGGANCEAPMGAALAAHAAAIDYVFSGPALHTLPEFLRCVLDGRTEAAHSIPGIVTSENHKTAGFAAAVGRDRDVEDFFEPDYDSFLEVFQATRDQLAGGRDIRPMLFFETSRGCWWGARSHCTFCGLNGLGMGYRAMSAETALRMFRQLFRYAPVCRTLAGVDNIMPKNYPREVFGKLAPPPGTSVFYEVKLPVSDRDLQAMASGGVNQVQPGIESISTETLRLMKKGTTAFQNLQFLKNCIRYSIHPSWSILVGFPGENPEVYAKYAEDIPLLRHLPPPMGAYMVRFDRYSPYYTGSAEHGLDLRPMDFYGLTFPFPAEAIEELAYYFVDRKLSPYLLAAAEWLQPLNHLVQEWLRAWSEDGASRPQLALRTDARGRKLVYDSRFDGDREIKIDQLDERVLRRLSSPARVDRLAGELGLAHEQVAELLDRYRKDRLLFQEGDQVMSLVVLDGGPGAATEASAEELASVAGTGPELPLIPLSTGG